MKLTKPILAVVAAGLLVTSAAFSQTAEATPEQRHAAHAERQLERLSVLLNLTATQKQQIQAIQTKYSTSNEPLRTQLRTLRDSFQAAMTAGNAVQIQTVSEQRGAVEGRLAVAMLGERTETRALLTPEQQTKLDQLRETEHGHGPGRGFGSRGFHGSSRGSSLR